jgi:ABC-type Fe2+-enterobactin transport system substrate-binding protein
VALLGDEENGFSTLGTARLNTNGFHATLLDHLRVVSGKSVVTVWTANFILHFYSSLKIIERLGRQAHTELRQERRRRGK